MVDDPSLRRLAFERGWINREQAESGRPLAELLSTPQIAELRTGQHMASRLLERGFLKGEDLAEREPERFGRYEIVRPLGEGGGGRVYLARDPQLGREVAVKILDRGVNVERFRREMEILAQLRHPNIVTIFDAGTEEGRPYYAMEYAGGESLLGKKLPLRKAVEVLEQVALACHAAHEMGIVHRDLKPANVLFSDRPLVADFGIAKVAGAELTETGQTLGTPYYMSPEQAEGREVDARTDIYSLGVLLYEAMTGQRPYTGTSTLEILRKVSQGDAAPPRSVDSTLPRDLEAVALKAMARDAKRRYPTARDFAAELRAWLEGRPVRARPPGRLERVGRALRRRPKLLVAAGAAALALLAFAVASPRLRYEAAQRLIHQEALRIQGWEVNLYNPASQMSYDDLERASANLRPVLGRDLPPGLLYEAHAAAARANLFMGRTEEARRNLDSAIALGAGLKIGEEYFERARLTWEIVLREQIAKNEKEVKRLAERIKEDLRAALRAGFRDDWMRDLAATLLKLLEKPKESVEQCLRELDQLGERKGKRSEVIAKFKGDLYLLLKDPARAIEEFEKAVKRRECYVQAWNGKALAYALKGRGESEEDVGHAFDAAARAIEINPAYEDSYFLFALLCREGLRSTPSELSRPNPRARELLLRGVEQLRVGSKARPDSVAIRTAHGTACAFLACLEPVPGPVVKEGTEALEAALARDPRRLEAWLALGIMHTVQALRGKLPSFEPARKSLERAREIAPENAWVHRWLGYWHYAAADGPAAAAAWRRAVEREPGLKDELEPAIRKIEGRR